MRNTVDPMPIYDDEFCKSTTLSFKKEEKKRKRSDSRRKKKSEKMKMK